MLNQLTSQEGKLQKKLLIIISFFLFFSHKSGQAQTTDTVAFKKDFELLLKKYDINSKGYQINVTSINQKGGQTALVINNNYFGDTLNGRNNFFWRIDSINNVLVCGPLKGVWATPFFAMDINRPKVFAYNPGNFSKVIHDIYENVNGKSHKLFTITTDTPNSQRDPMKIYLSEIGSEDFVIFGDFQDPLKKYLYKNGQVVYLGN